jgi:hypothetical protein
VEVYVGHRVWAVGGSTLVFEYGGLLFCIQSRLAYGHWGSCLVRGGRMGSGMEREMWGSWTCMFGMWCGEHGEVFGMRDRGVLGNFHVAEEIEPWDDVLVYIASWTQCEGNNEVMS